MANPLLGGRGGLLVLCCVTLLLGLPGAAWATPTSPTMFPTEACPVHGHIESNVSYSCAAEFTLRGSNGYRITVSADAEGRSNEVQLSAEGHLGTVQYSAPGKVTPTIIKAKFGHLGRISVRFEPSGRERNVRVRRKCMKGRPSVVTSRLGRFVGTIKFRGERGYTRTSAHSAQGGTGDPLANTPKKLQCDFHESDAERERELESVALDGSPPGAGVSFSAFRLFGNSFNLTGLNKQFPPKNDRYLFLVIASEKAGAMSIFRTTGSLGESQDFIFDQTLTSATVRPPSPFTGSGTFLRNADGSTTWTGSLAVPLAGLGTINLTGGKAQLQTVATGLNQLEEEFEVTHGPAMAGGGP
jgi:hypothetical protein